MAAGLVKVTVLSPHPAVVEGFSAMLGRHPERIELIGLIEPFHDLEPDVVLYDVVALADGDGCDLDELVEKTASVVFAVARDLRPDLLAQALGRGVDGFFSLSTSEEQLLAAIESAMTGWEVGDPGPDPVVGSSRSEQGARRLGHDAGLSARETRVLALITQGLTNDEIASRDFISVNTVKSYIRTAYRKIGVASRAQAAIWTVQHGFATDVDVSVFEADPGPG